MAKRKKRSTKRVSKDPNLVSVKIIAAMGDLNERTVRKMAVEGELVRVEEGLYNLKHAFNLFLDKAVRGVVSNNKINSPSSAVIMKNKVADSAEVNQRYNKAKADLAELEVQIERRDKLDMSSVRAFLGSEVATFKRELLSLPRGLPNEMFGLSEQEMRIRLREIFDQILDESDERFNYSALMEYLDD